MTAAYKPPRVWSWDPAFGGSRFAKINRPTAGATHEAELPVGKHPLQLYSLATPNGVKVTVMLEELLALKRPGAQYDAWLIDIHENEQFGSGFVEINPNSKIPALLDRSGETPVRVFESGSILLYLAEKFGAFLPTDHAGRTETLNWLFWQIGATPYLGGGFGHFYNYCDDKYEYPINRYAMEVKRQLDVLDQRLADRRYVAGDEYTIADMAIWPWYGGLLLNRVYKAARFLNAKSYRNVMRWTEEIAARPAVTRGRQVNRRWGPEEEQLPERHSSRDFAKRDAALAAGKPAAKKTGKAATKSSAKVAKKSAARAAAKPANRSAAKRAGKSAGESATGATRRAAAEMATAKTSRKTDKSKTDKKKTGKKKARATKVR